MPFIIKDIFRFRQNFNYLKSNGHISPLYRQNQHLSRTAFHSRFLFSASDHSTKKITLPKIRDEKLLASILKHNDDKYRFCCFYGDKAYNYYVTGALYSKLPNVTRKEFVRMIGDVLVTRKFLTKVAKVCELDKMMSHYTKSSCHLGELMEAYCTGMLFNGMEEDMKKFASDVVDYYLSQREPYKIDYHLSQGEPSEKQKKLM